jgi:hypothetical protein
MSVLTRVRRPEYTGDNRCVPCTVLNVALALVLAGGGGAVGLRVTDSLLFGGAVGGLVAIVGLSAIVLRGYLVPGTPTLTKRYLPDRVLAWFDKAPTTEMAADPDVDIERVLRAADAVEPCQHGTDLCLTDAFAADWEREIDRASETDVDPAAIADVLHLPTDELEVHDHGSAFMLTVAGDVRRHVGQWESAAAFYADMGGARALAKRTTEWRRLNAMERSAVLGGLRVFLHRCPACGGDVSFGEESVESCCREIDVVAVSCADCGARLFEQPTAELLAAA